MVRSINALRDLNRQQQGMTSELAYIVEEAAAGHKIVKVHGGEDYEMQRFMDKAERSAPIHTKSGCGGRT